MDSAGACGSWAGQEEGTGGCTCSGQSHSSAPLPPAEARGQRQGWCMERTQLRKYSGERLWGSGRFGEARMGQQLWGHMSSRPDLPLERPPLSQPRRESCLRKPSLRDFRDPLSPSLISAAQGRQRELWRPKSPGSSPDCTLLSQGPPLRAVSAQWG